eukprot:TRINITY_DN15667_c0_g1_i1.p1 TRINITY_DN15667_c0_g1~~TRINITY_DN15667_c0_g1_i1.p1  ORF type:complete len:639 (-),score=62.37 TRINITY_DN15667_c0_g1_i1:185-2101(-)
MAWLITSFCYRLLPPNLANHFDVEVGVDLDEAGKQRARTAATSFLSSQTRWFLGLLALGQACFGALNLAEILDQRAQKGYCYANQQRAFICAYLQVCACISCFMKGKARVSTQCCAAVSYVVGMVCALYEHNSFRYAAGLYELDMQVGFGCRVANYWDILPESRHAHRPEPDLEAEFYMVALSLYYFLFVLDFRRTTRVACPCLLICFAAILIAVLANDHFGLVWFMRWPSVYLPILSITIAWQHHHEKAVVLTFEASEALRQSAVQERVHRCRAEFEAERLQEGRKQVKIAVVQKDEAVSSVSITVPSFKSLPADLVTSKLLCHEGDDGVDCLPEDCHVFLEGDGNSVPLSSVQEGTRILCLDSLLSATAYVRVDELMFNDGVPDCCVSVVLDDGSSMVMTADHPVKVTGAVIPAESLKPDVHTIQCLRVVDLKVRNVEVARNSSDTRLVGVRIADGQRYSIVATASKSSSPLLTSIPVGSIDAHMHHHGGQLDMKSGRLRRSNSAPPSLFSCYCRKEPTPIEGFSETRTSDSVSLEVVMPQQTSILPKGQRFSSIGSIHHKDGTCMPCKFHKAFLLGTNADPCEKGIDCEYCHEGLHEGISRYQARRRSAVAQTPRKPAGPLPAGPLPDRSCTESL